MPFPDQLQNFLIFPGQEKSHFFYKHIYKYLYYSFSLIMSVHHNTVMHWHNFGWAVIIVQVGSNGVQTIGTIIWKRCPDDHKWPGWLRRPLLITSGHMWGLYKYWSDLEMLSDEWDYRRDDRRLSQKSWLSFDLDTAEAENNFKMFALRMGTIWN